MIKATRHKLITAKSFKKGFLLLLTLGFFVLAFGQESFNPDDLLKPRTGKQTLVNDFAHILTEDQRHALENKLVAIDDSTSTQIAVVIVPTIGNKTISDFNVELARAWGVGSKKNNNGVVLLIAKDDRKLDITVGYGLEGSLPDITANSIINDIIVPNFKGNDYYRGIDEGTDAIIAAVEGRYQVAREHKGKSIPAGKIILIIIIVLFILISSSGGNKGGTFMSRRGARGLPGPIFWPSGGSGSGGAGGGWGGGGSSGGGGFGGFGGGGFGGGGSSGSW